MKDMNIFAVFCMFFLAIFLQNQHQTSPRQSFRGKEIGVEEKKTRLDTKYKCSENRCLV